MQVTDKAYTEHRVFVDLDQYALFYKSLSMSIFSFVSMGMKSIFNIDTYAYSSMQGTLESIKVILFAGRINDAYALLRKYYDSAIINVYSNLYLKDHFRIENFVVEKIDNWLHGKERLPEYRVMSQYIRASHTLGPINNVLYTDDRSPGSFRWTSTHGTLEEMKRSMKARSCTGDSRSLLGALMPLQML